MTSSIQFLRSTTAQERPQPDNLLEGQPAVNINSAEPGLFFKTSDNDIVKIGPTAITTDGLPPNSNPAGHIGYCKGEMWFDAATTPGMLKIFDGESWQTVSDSGVEPYTIATQSEAEAGTNNSALMTPLRTAQAIDARVTKLRDTVSVKDFGAKGDGATDDTEAIQTAVNSGEIIFFPAGTYIISSPIFLQDESTLISFGKARIKQIDNNPNRASFFAMMVAEGAIKNYIRISGLIFDGNSLNNIDHGAPNPSGNQDPFWSGVLLTLVALSKIKYVTVENCLFENSFASGLWITNCSDSRIVGNTVRNFRITGIGIRDYNPLSGIESDRTVVSNNIVEGGVVGIHGIFGAKNVAYTGNVVSNLRDSNRFPSFAYSGTYPNVWPTEGGFNTPSDPGYVSPALPGDGAGIELTGKLTDPTADICTSISITGNTASNCIVGLRVEETSKNVSICGNSVNFTDNSGILVFSATDTVISSNTVTNSQNTGITVQSLSTTINPSAVRTRRVSITSNSVTDSQFYGLALGNVENVTIVGNLFSNNNLSNSSTGGAVTMFEIDSSPCTNCIFSGNQFINSSGNDAYGILSGSVNNINNLVTSNFFSSFNVSATNLSPVDNSISNNIGI